MKQLNDKDIENMIGEEFKTDENSVKKQVRQSLRLSTRIHKPVVVPTHKIIDFHGHTEEQAWNMLMDVIKSGARSATVITGASGILKIKFQQWASNSIISDKILSFEPLNNGSFSVKFHKPKD